MRRGRGLMIGGSPIGLITLSSSGNGGVDPAVAALRLQAASGGQPGTMSSPPTITQSSAWFTSNPLYAWNNGNLRRLNGDWAQADTVFPRNGCGAPASITYDLGAGNWGQGGPQGAIEFICADAFFEFAVLGSGNARYRIYCNGENGGETADLANDGGDKVFKVDFGTAATRTIRIEEVRGRAVFGNVRTATPPVATSAPSSKLVIFGDSFTEGTGAATRVQGFSHMIARELGFRDYLLSGSGGTGWVNPGVRVNGFNRWTLDVVNRAPTMLICLMGLNDNSTGNDALIQSTLPTKLNELLAAQPNCLVHVFGIFDTAAPSAWIAGFESVNNAIIAGATGIPRVWTHNLKGISYTKADATHPDTAGHTTLYKAIYNKIAAVHGLRTVA